MAERRNAVDEASVYLSSIRRDARDKCERGRRRICRVQVPGIGNWSTVTVLVRTSIPVMKHHD